MQASDKTISAAAAPRTWVWRDLKDRIVRHMVEIGGIAVIIAILLIFLFLLSVVWPLFKAPSATELNRYAVPAQELGKTLYLSVEEQAEVGMRLTDQGTVVFFNAHNGELLSETRLPVPANSRITDFSLASEHDGLAAVALNTGGIIVFAHKYSPDFSTDKRIIIPRVEYPFGTEPIGVDPDGRAITRFNLGANDDSLAMLAQLSDGSVTYQRWTKKSSLLGRNVSLIDEGRFVLDVPPQVFELLVDEEQEWVYVLSQHGELFVFNVRGGGEPVLNENLRVVPRGHEPTHLSFLTGDISILVGDSTGLLSQWFHSRVQEDQGRYVLKLIREFQIGDSKITSVSPEVLRKGVLAANQSGEAHLIYTTSERELIEKKVSDVAIVHTAISPRSEFFLAQDENNLVHAWEIDSSSPEASFKSIWGKVWYEDYPEPEYIWQSSSASSDFEPKFSLVPLTFGTIKAAFYAMLFAMPLAICGAIFTAYFMAPKMRGIVKPSIEIMEALPTVILGFLAGLWLAPFVEKHLPGVFSVFFLMPFVLMFCAMAWWKMPDWIKVQVPDGWQAALLIPPVILAAWLCIFVSPYIETWLFGGDIRLWMQQSLGVDYDQRNALIIGISMGFAVIPTIFSIAEDAIFSVPKHLTSGSLALGATPWQTLVRVVMPSASPGIFSAVMIGFGRAVGETMIVLMATGNTPVMDMSIFQGMRTLSANVAVELPESEVGSTHYRILFLAALVLFIFTFFFNTIAEVVRQRLRNKYSNL